MKPELREKLKNKIIELVGEMLDEGELVEDISAEIISIADKEVYELDRLRTIRRS